MINGFNRKGLRVPESLRDVTIYCRKSNLKLPYNFILRGSKGDKARLLSISEDSDDPVQKTMQPTIKMSRKLKIVEAKIKLKNKMKEVICQTQAYRKALGLSETKWWSKAEEKEIRDIVVKEIVLNVDSRQYSNRNRKKMD